MQRVKRSTAVVALSAAPAGGTPGYFAQPNPGGGVPATVPGYEWYNSIQEELCAVIAAAGAALDITNTSQLLAALRAAGVFQTQATGDQTTKAATTAFANPANSLAASGYQKLPSGLIIQWGSLTFAANTTDYIWTFPIAFPNASIAGSAMHAQAGVAVVSEVINSSGLGASQKTGATFRINAASGLPTGVYFIVIGN